MENNNIENNDSEKKTSAGQDKLKAIVRSKAFGFVAYGLIALVFAYGVYTVLMEFVLYDPSSTAYNPPPTAPAITSTPNSDVTPTPSPTPVVSPTDAANSEEEYTPLPDGLIPAMIYFEEQKLQGPIIFIGFSGVGQMGAPESSTEAGWFYYSAPPGEEGNSIINGHQAYQKKKGLFAVLKTMEIGDRVIIEFRDGSVRYFEAYFKETYKAADVPKDKINQGGETRLTLITCLGDRGDDGYSKSRVVVECRELVELRHGPAVDE